MKTYSIANIVFVKKDGRFGIRSFDSRTIEEMKSLVISRIGYVPQWVCVEVLGENNISLA